ncbi:class I SAM-dependent methyltransferase [Synechococcus sp. UW105]|uniref:class I SAM-dependent methyltransferase n=1 Tax=Synechococcus sp. UW105 TaxID=337067 RepID=UPI000E0EEDCE|nr:class I SAM-dependent methyltransferase [Synechococcus sp. UW105]|tara:strand:+ start:264 stop:1223 length:960 start_codon:yes stop_codon:yes gene_type:complete
MTVPVSAPHWADSSQGLGRWIERLISIGVLRRPLFFQARQLIIRTAERNGIPWRRRRSELRDAATPLLAQSTTPGLLPPDYYRVRFHAYEEGNLCWQAAAEAEQATDAMALRVWPEETLSPGQAQARLRNAIHQAVEPMLSGRLEQVLDLGCSVGVSTQALADWLAGRAAAAGKASPRVVGLDLSPEMLAVARVRDVDGVVAEWRHAAAEHTGLAAGCIDLISLQFVCHELPQTATHAVLKEAARLLRPGGVLVMVDQDPASSVLQALPAPVATLLKSTEPYIEQYFGLDMEAALHAAGFHALEVSACDPRHRVIACLR